MEGILNKLFVFTMMSAFSASVLAAQGDLKDLKQATTLTAAKMQSTMNKYCPKLAFKYPNKGMLIYKVTYETVNVDKSPTLATGLLAIPDAGQGPYALLSDQHGTALKRTDAPSNLNLDGSLAASCYGSQGYVIAAADYLGYGGSEIKHPFLHADSEAWVAADLLRAVKMATAQLGVQLNGKLFLTGYSQGGHVTLALHRHLEKNLHSEFTVTASAPGSGVYDLTYTFFATLKKPSAASTIFVAYGIWSAQNTYSIFKSLEEPIQGSYAGKLNKLFDGSSDWLQAFFSLPRDIHALLQPAFERDIAADANHPYLKVLASSDVFDWKPSAPIHFFHASGDTIVPFENANRTVKHMKNLGATVELTDLGNLDHLDGMGPARQSAAKWLAGF